MPAGTGNERYKYTFEQVIEPIVHQYQPELIFVSAGQDASRFDPLGRMLVTVEGFHQMASRVKSLAEQHCGGRLIACHEGGYSTAHAPFCALKILEAFRGKRSEVEDLFDQGYHEGPIYQNQIEAIDKVKKIQAGFWDFS